MSRLPSSLRSAGLKELINYAKAQRGKDPVRRHAARQLRQQIKTLKRDGDTYPGISFIDYHIILQQQGFRLVFQEKIDVPAVVKHRVENPPQVEILDGLVTVTLPTKPIRNTWRNVIYHHPEKNLLVQTTIDGKRIFTGNLYFNLSPQTSDTTFSLDGFSGSWNARRISGSVCVEQGLVKAIQSLESRGAFVNWDEPPLVSINGELIGKVPDETQAKRSIVVYDQLPQPVKELLRLTREKYWDTNGKLAPSGFGQIRIRERRGIGAKA